MEIYLAPPMIRVQADSFKSGAAPGQWTFHIENEMFVTSNYIYSNIGSVLGVLYYCDVILLLCVFYVSDYFSAVFCGPVKGMSI